MAAAMYTVYHVVLVKRLPIAQQDRLVVMHPLDKRGTHLDVQYRRDLPQVAWVDG